MPILIYFTSHKLHGKTSDDIELELNEWQFVLSMSLVHLRLWYVRSVGVSLSHVFDILQEVYYMHRILLANLLSWFFAAIKLIVFMHYFACGWIFINVNKVSNG